AAHLRWRKRRGVLLGGRVPPHAPAARGRGCLRPAVHHEHRWDRTASRVEWAWPHDLRLLLRERHPDFLRQHLRRQPPVPYAARLLEGLRLGYDGGAFYAPDGKMIGWRAWYPEPGQEAEQYQALLKQGLVRPSRMELWVANADGSNARQVTKLGGANFAPYFHPDGKRIVFASNHK